MGEEPAREIEDHRLVREPPVAAARAANAGQAALAKEEPEVGVLEEDRLAGLRLTNEEIEREFVPIDPVLLELIHPALPLAAPVVDALAGGDPGVELTLAALATAAQDERDQEPGERDDQQAANANDEGGVGRGCAPKQSRDHGDEQHDRDTCDGPDLRTPGGQ